MFLQVFQQALAADALVLKREDAVGTLVRVGTGEGMVTADEITDDSDVDTELG